MPVVLDSGNPDSLVFDHAPCRTLHGIDNTYEQTTRQESPAAARGQIQPAPAVGTPAGGGPSPAIYLCTASLLTAVGGSLILAALTLLRGRRLGRLLKNAEPGSRDLQEAASRVARLMGLCRGLSIRVVDGSVTPLLWVPLHGPMIVLPQRLLAQLTDQQLAAVIAHETAHYVRRDHWSNWFAFAVSVVFWWHPVVWIARRRLSEAQEQCCDVRSLPMESLDGEPTRRRSLLLWISSLASDRWPPPRCLPWEALPRCDGGSSCCAGSRSTIVFPDRVSFWFFPWRFFFPAFPLRAVPTQRPSKARPAAIPVANLNSCCRKSSRPFQRTTPRCAVSRSRLRSPL